MLLSVETVISIRDDVCTIWFDIWYYSCQENDNNGNMPSSDIQRERRLSVDDMYDQLSGICYFKLKVLACQDLWK